MITTAKPRNVFEAIKQWGHDEDYDPVPAQPRYLSTDAPPGSREKIEILRRRIEWGQPLWHNDDRVDFNGLVGAVRPREDDFLIGRAAKFNHEPDQDAVSGAVSKASDSENRQPEIEVQMDRAPKATLLVRPAVEDRERTLSAQEPPVATSGLAEREEVKVEVAAKSAPNDTSVPATPEVVIKDTPYEACNSSNQALVLPSLAVCAESIEEAMPASGRQSPEAANTLRTPNDKELRLINSYKETVGTSINADDFKRFLVGLRDRGVDVQKYLKSA